MRSKDIEISQGNISNKNDEPETETIETPQGNISNKNDEPVTETIETSQDNIGNKKDEHSVSFTITNHSSDSDSDSKIVSLSQIKTFTDKSDKVLSNQEDYNSLANQLSEACWNYIVLKNKEPLKDKKTPEVMPLFLTKHAVNQHNLLIESLQKQSKTNQSKDSSSDKQQKEKIKRSIEERIKTINDPKLLKALLDNIDIFKSNNVITAYPCVLLESLTQYPEETALFLSKIYISRYIPIDIENKNDLKHFLYAIEEFTSFSICITTLIMKSYDNQLWGSDKVLKIADLIDEALLRENLYESYFFDSILYILKRASGKNIVDLYSYLNNYGLTSSDLFPKDKPGLGEVANIIFAKFSSKINQFIQVTEVKNVIKEDSSTEDQIRYHLEKVKQLQLQLKRERELEHKHEHELQNTLVKNSQKAIQPDNTEEKTRIINDIINRFSGNPSPFPILVMLLCLARLPIKDEKPLYCVQYLFSKLDLEEIEGESIIDIFCSLEKLNFSLYCVDTVIKYALKVEEVIEYAPNIDSESNVKVSEGTPLKREKLISALFSIEREHPILIEEMEYSMSGLIFELLENVGSMIKFSSDGLENIIREYPLLGQRNKNWHSGESDSILKKKQTQIISFINKSNPQLLEHYKFCDTKLTELQENLKKYYDAPKWDFYVECIKFLWGEVDKQLFNEVSLLSLLQLISQFDSDILTDDITDKVLQIIRFSDSPVDSAQCIKLLKHITENSKIYTDKTIGIIKKYLTENKDAKEVACYLFDPKVIKERFKQKGIGDYQGDYESVAHLLERIKLEERIDSVIQLTEGNLIRDIKRGIKKGENLTQHKKSVKDLVQDLEGKIEPFDFCDKGPDNSNRGGIIFISNQVFQPNLEKNDDESNCSFDNHDSQNSDCSDDDNHSPTEIIEKSTTIPPFNPEMFFRQFKLTPFEAYDLLVGNLDSIITILEPASNDAMTQDTEFNRAISNYLHRLEESPEKVNKKEVIRVYISHVFKDILNNSCQDPLVLKKWPHPLVLKALAQIKEINLQVWESEKEELKEVCRHFAKSKADTINLLKNNDGSYELYSPEPPFDPEMLFKQLGLTPREAHDLLVEHVDSILTILEPASTDAMKQNIGFNRYISYLSDLKNRYPEVYKKRVIIVYISYVFKDILNKSGQDPLVLKTWPHPLVLEALAQIKKINLQVWESNKEELKKVYGHIAKRRADTINLLKNNDGSYKLYSPEPPFDPEMLFKQLGLTPREAHDLLVEHVDSILTILEPASTDARNQDTEFESAIHEYVRSLEDGPHSHYKKGFISLYISYVFKDILNKSGQDPLELKTWPHPLVLKALAQIKEINLYVWESDKEKPKEVCGHIAKKEAYTVNLLKNKDGSYKLYTSEETAQNNNSDSDSDSDGDVEVTFISIDDDPYLKEEYLDEDDEDDKEENENNHSSKKGGGQTNLYKERNRLFSSNSKMPSEPDNNGDIWDKKKTTNYASENPEDNKGIRHPGY